MKSVKTVVMVAILACTVAAYGQSVVVYTVETGGNNNAALWEDNQSPTYVSGVTDGSTVVQAGQDLNWAVRVSVGGSHDGQPGDGYPPLGAANLVFDLVVLKDGVPADLGAAPMACDSGSPGQAGAANCRAVGKGFYSTINDGDEDGIRGGLVRDAWANAAFAVSIYNTEVEPQQKLSLIDPVPGPNFDYGWYPTANGRGGVDIDGTKPVNTSINKPELNGKLVGFGAGYKNFHYNSYRPGVGAYEVEIGGQLGFGADIGWDPLNPIAAERPLFEGQICTKGMEPGTYYLKVIPSANGNNILHGYVDWTSPTPSYGGAGSFAAKANSAVALPAQVNGVKFVVEPAPEETAITKRAVFYNNSYYDGNKVGIDPAPGPGTRDDDADAIDTSKTPLISGTSTFANVTGYNKGLNGLIYEFEVASSSRDPLASDFTFTNLTRTGTAAGTAVSPSASQLIVLQASSPRKVRMVFTFADNSLKNVWLKVGIGTGFGLAGADTHYWGNAAGDTGVGNVSPNFLTSGSDELAARSNPTTVVTRSPVTDPHDINKTSLVDGQDQLWIRSNPTTAVTCLRYVTK